MFTNQGENAGIITIVQTSTVHLLMTMIIWIFINQEISNQDISDN